MRVIFTCGGTAGHINPAITLANLIRKNIPGSRILFVGAKGGMESTLVPKAGFHFVGVDISNFHREISKEALRHNWKTVENLAHCPAEAIHIVRKFKPDVVVGTGGYASYPLVKYAALCGIPTAVHEANAYPGLTTRQLERYVKLIMVNFEACKSHYLMKHKVMVTGMPVRGEFFELTKEEAKKELGVDDGRPLIVSFWGSLGAKYMNEKMVDFIAEEVKEAKYHHIHAVGKAGYEEMMENLTKKGIDLSQYPDIDVRDYIYDMPHVMRAADLVISRGGASTISEITSLEVPAIIAPSPYVTNNHQEKNAMILEQEGAVAIVREKECDGHDIYAKACEILDDEDKRRQMSEASRRLNVEDSYQKIYDAIMGLVK